MADTMTIPANLAAKAKEKGWPDDLVEHALAWLGSGRCNCVGHGRIVDRA